MSIMTAPGGKQHKVAAWNAPSANLLWVRVHCRLPRALYNDAYMPADIGYQVKNIGGNERRRNLCRWRRRNISIADRRMAYWKSA